MITVLIWFIVIVINFGIGFITGYIHVINRDYRTINKITMEIVQSITTKETEDYNDGLRKALKIIKNHTNRDSQRY